MTPNSAEMSSGMSNPFIIDDLLMLDTLNIIDEYVIKTHSGIGGQRSVQQVQRHSDQAPHTLDS